MADRSAAERRELCDIAERASDLAAAQLQEAFGRGTRAVEHKGAIDLVTETDQAVEALVRAELSAATGFDILGEEGGRSGSEGDGPIWVIDPIDGTTNFVHGIPHFAVSIGLWDGRDAPVGVVHDPIKRERFSTAGDGVRCNGVLVPTPRGRELGDAVLATGFAYDRRTNPDDNRAEFNAIFKHCRGIRRMGAASLDLAYVAAGRLDGYWEARLKPWDVMGGLALSRAAGVLVTDYAGASWTLESTSTVAAPPSLHGTLLASIAAARSAR